MESQAGQERETYLQLVERSPDAMLLLSEGNIVLANDAALRLFHTDKESISGQPFLPRVHPDFLETLKEKIRLALEEDQSALMEGKLLRADGSEITVEASSAGISFSGKRAVHFVLRDVSERKARERRMAAQHSTTMILAGANTFVQAAPHIIEAVCESLNWDLGQFWMVDQKLQQLRCVRTWHEREIPDFERISKATLFPPGVGLPGRVWTSREPAWIVDVVVDPNFPRAPYAAKAGLHGAFAFPIHIGTEFIGVMEFFSAEFRQPDKDVLQMFASLGSQIGQFVLRKRSEAARAKLIEELEHANRELKDFAYVVSHDLKAPLRAIGSLASWISTDYADKLDADGKEQLELLISRVTRMHNLIDGVLQYSRAARVEGTRILMDLNEFVPQVVQMIAPPANITIQADKNLPTVSADPTRMQQVFQNLLSNAIKYMDKPEGLIRISCQAEDGFWKFTVSDNGPGIEARHFERIFQLFQTLVPKDERESTGVGLAIVKKIIEMYGGKVSIESTVGQGSHFSFTFPNDDATTEKTSGDQS